MSLQGLSRGLSDQPLETSQGVIQQQASSSKLNTIKLAPKELEGFAAIWNRSQTPEDSLSVKGNILTNGRRECVIICPNDESSSVNTPLETLSKQVTVVFSQTASHQEAVAQVEDPYRDIVGVPHVLRDDKKFMLKAIEENPERLNLASEALKADKDVVRAAVTRSGSVLDYASTELWNDKELIKDALVASKSWMYVFNREQISDVSLKQVTGLTDLIPQKIFLDALNHSSPDVKETFQLVGSLKNFTTDSKDSIKHSLNLGPVMLQAGWLEHAVCFHAFPVEGKDSIEVRIFNAGDHSSYALNKGYPVRHRMQGEKIGYASFQFSNTKENISTLIEYVHAIAHQLKGEEGAEHLYRKLPEKLNATPGSVPNPESFITKQRYGNCSVHSIDACLKTIDVEKSRDFRHTMRSRAINLAEQSGEDPKVVEAFKTLLDQKLEKNTRQEPSQLKEDKKALFTAAKEKILQDLAKNPMALKNASSELKEDKEVVLAAVTRDGKALQYASSELKYDKDVVLAAVGKDGKALEHACMELKADEEVVLEAVFKDGAALEFADSKLKKNPGILMPAVSTNRRALLFCDIDKLQEDHPDLARAIVQAAVFNDGDALMHAGTFRNDYTIVLEAFRNKPRSLLHAPEELLHHPQIQQEVVADKKLIEERTRALKEALLTHDFKRR